MMAHGCFRESSFSERKRIIKKRLSLFLTFCMLLSAVSVMAVHVTATDVALTPDTKWCDEHTTETDLYIGCFKQFAKDYGKQVQVSYLITNALPDSVKPTAEANNTDLSRAESWCGSFAGKTSIIKMHAGQSAWFCNTELQMLFTHETLHPAKVRYLNETSTVFMLRVNGQKILITADCELQETDALVKLWGDELKADIYQINHHGYSGVTTGLIQAVNPAVALWPTSETTAAKRRLTAWYNELQKRMELCIVADGNAKVLTLPYQTGMSCEDYQMNFGKRESGQ